MVSLSQYPVVNNEWTLVDSSVSINGYVFGTIVQGRRGHVVASDETRDPKLVRSEGPRVHSWRNLELETDNKRVVGKIYSLWYSWNFLFWVPNNLVEVVGTAEIQEKELPSRWTHLLDPWTDLETEKGEQKDIQSCRSVDRKKFRRIYH